MPPLPGPRTRVLIVDDSVVARRMVANAIEGDEGMEVAGVAANGRVALDRLPFLRPDVVVLDLEMPQMDGFQTLKALRLTHPTLPVIVFSNLSSPGARATLDALALGASDFTLKPSATSGDALEQVRAGLLPLIRALAPPRALPSHAVPTPQVVPTPQAVPTLQAVPTPQAVPVLPPGPTAPVDAVVVAVSTGGPRALATLLGDLPGDLPVPVLIVQHMPPVFTAMLAERLDAGSALIVTEAAGGEPVERGHAYVAPGGRHLAVARESLGVRTVLQDGPPENSCRPSADVLFRSAAAAYGSRVLAVVLTGMGSDGLRGTEAIVAAGGSAVAQDPATSVVSSMPGAVAAAGLGAVVLPLDGIAAHVVRRASRTGARP